MVIRQLLGASRKLILKIAGYLLSDRLFFQLIGRKLGRNSIIKQCNVSGLKHVNDHCIIKDSYFEGSINIADHCRIQKSLLKGKINVLSDCSITNSTICSDVTIYESSIIEDTELKGTIVLKEGLKLIGGSIKIYGNIEIGRYSSLNGPNLDIYSQINKVRIGNFCSIARNVSFQEYNHRIDRISSYFINGNLIKDKSSSYNEIESKGDIIIENDVWIGTHCVILSGAYISNGAVIAANSVVTGYIPPYAIAGGNPAKVIKFRFDDSVIDELLKSAWWNWSVEKIKSKANLFLKECDNEVLAMLAD